MSAADLLLAATKPAPGSHPDAELLRQYAAGTLAPAEQHRIEAHTLDCDTCADILEGFLMTDAATTNEAISTLRARLQTRLAEEAPRVVVAPRWPRTLAAAAALAGLTVGGIWGWQQLADETQLASEMAVVMPKAEIRPSTPAPAVAPAPPSATEAEAPITSGLASSAADESADKMLAVAPPPRLRRAATRQADAQRMEMEEKASYGAAETANAGPDISDLAGAADAPVVASAPAKAPMPASEPPVVEAESRPMASPPIASVMRKATAAKSRSAVQTADSLQTLAKKETADMGNRALAGRVAGVSVANTPMPAAPAIYPAPVGGTMALREYLRRTAAEFDPEINNLRINGTVHVKFIVGADGKLSNLKVSRGLRADYDAEALRIVCEGPAWTPGIAGGKRAPIPMEVTVPF